MDFLLKLIDKGDATAILAEENITKAFDELLRYDLIDIIEERVCLTRKGKKAKELGMKNFLEQNKTDPVRSNSHQQYFKTTTSTNLLFQSLLPLFALVAAFLLS